MLFSSSKLSVNQRYHLMTQTIIPRPIAWVLTENANQTLNLAPYSYFNAVSSDPAVVMLSMGYKPDSEFKDSRRNILEQKQFVIHIPSSDQAELVNASAETLAYGESEIDALSLSVVSQQGFDLPRLKDCSVAMACKLYEYHEIGDSKQGVIYGEITEFYIADEIANTVSETRLEIDAFKLNPLSRLGGSFYGTLGEAISVKRPK